MHLQRLKAVKFRGRRKKWKAESKFENKCIVDCTVFSSRLSSSFIVFKCILYEVNCTLPKCTLRHELVIREGKVHKITVEVAFFVKKWWVETKIHRTDTMVCTVHCCMTSGWAVLIIRNILFQIFDNNNEKNAKHSFYLVLHCKET